MRKINLLTALVVFVLPSLALAQDRTGSISLAGGVAGSAFFNNTKFPGYTAQLWLELPMRQYEDRNWWLALGHSILPAKPGEVKEYDPTSTEKATYHYYPSSITTLTIGGRRYYASNFIIGLGGGLSIHRQGLTKVTYPDPAMNYESAKSRQLFGFGTVAHLGYKFGGLQLLVNYQGSSTFFRTIDVSDPDDVNTNSFVAAFGVSAAYTF